MKAISLIVFENGLYHVYKMIKYLQCTNYHKWGVILKIKFCQIKNKDFVSNAPLKLESFNIHNFLSYILANIILSVEFEFQDYKCNKGLSNILLLTHHLFTIISIIEESWANLINSMIRIYLFWIFIYTKIMIKVLNRMFGESNRVKLI